MKTNMILGLIISMLALIACRDQNSPSNAGAIEARSPHSGIYNGQVATDKNLIARSTVLILIPKPGGSPAVCSGSVLSSKVILTAAHCVTDASVSPESEKFIFSEEKISVANQELEDLAVEKVLVNPGYLREKRQYQRTREYNPLLLGYDLALIKLREPLPEFYQPVILSTNLQEIFSENSFVAGYGFFRSEEGFKVDFRLRHGPVKMETVELSAPWEVVNTAASRLLIYRKQAEGAGVCKGDSGGPLYYEKEGRIHQFGVNVETRFFERKDRVCIFMESDHQVSAFVAGYHRQFLAEAYRELTGENLAHFDVPAAGEDPNRFEFYQKNPQVVSKNKSLDLSQSMVVIRARSDGSKVYHVVAKDLGSEACKDSALRGSKIAPLHMSLDGVSPVAFMKGEGDSYASFEARVLDKGREFQVTVLTLEGFVNATLPVVRCP